MGKRRLQGVNGSGVGDTGPNPAENLDPPVILLRGIVPFDGVDGEHGEGNKQVVGPRRG